LMWNYRDAEAEAEAEAEAAVTSMRMEGLPVGVRRVLVEEYRIDDTHSNAYTVWKGMGSPQRPSAEQIAELKRVDGLELLRSPKWVDVVDGRVVVKTTLPGESIELVRVSW
jgi:xylan 1,4-beta-xylosidase